MAICFYQFSSRRLIKHFKPRSQWKKWSVQHQVVLFNVLNDEFVVGHVGLVPAPRSAVTVLSVDAISEN